MDTLTQEGALLAETFGVPLLAYLCAVDEDGISRRLEGQTELGPAQEEVLSQLLAHATRLAADASTKSVPVALRLDVLGRFDERAQTSVGNALRLHAGGEIELAVPDDAVLGPLTHLLRDAFPLMLVPTERTFFPRLHLTGALWTSPHRKAFEEALLADPDLSRLFLETSDEGGWTSMIYRSTGAGGTIQLWSLPDLLLTNAWWLGEVANDRGMQKLATHLQVVTDLLREAVRGDACKVKSLVGLTGIVFDGVEKVELPFGILRPIREHERGLAPPSLEGAVSYTSADGDTVTASYAGDVVFESAVDYRLRIDRPGADLTAAWPADLRHYESLEANLDTIRLAALLTGKAETTLTLAPTWRMLFDPLSWGPIQSWSDPRVGPSIAPRRITPAAANELANWAEAIHRYRGSGIDVAVRRTISAMASRADPVDALVDLVIVWENLLGSRQGEPTLRISAALGWLLGSSPAEREEHRSRTTRVYGLRSDIVHGNRVVAPDEAAEALVHARAMTLAALRELFGNRLDLLAMKNGDERSRALIMGA
jgi:hypothetical protein